MLHIFKKNQGFYSKAEEVPNGGIWADIANIQSIQSYIYPRPLLTRFDKIIYSEYFWNPSLWSCFIGKEPRFIGRSLDWASEYPNKKQQNKTCHIYELRRENYNILLLKFCSILCQSRRIIFIPRLLWSRFTTCDATIDSITDCPFRFYFYLFINIEAILNNFLLLIYQ